MKELTIEEKAKRYDETIEKLRDFYRDYDTVSCLIDVKEELANLFPELRESESEDERIRKWLIEMVGELRKANQTNADHNGDCSDAIAWLEKRKESELSKDLGEYIAELSKQFPEVSFAKLSRIAVRVKNWLEKQGWQKSWDSVKPVSEEDKLYLMPDEQKPADTTDRLKEEYKKGWDDAMQQLPKEVDSQIWQIANNAAKTWEESFAILCATQKAYDRGKKDALKEQKFAEWSEEDYNEIETIACHLDNIDNEGMAEVLRNIRDKYYHIFPQSTWKPSDEQMEALKGVQEGVFRLGILESLYQDLKKLKGISYESKRSTR